MPGSGKTTVARMIADQLGLEHVSMGALRGRLAIERGMTIQELNDLGEREAWTDKEIDDHQTKLGKTKDNFVIDGRTSYHFIPNSIKVYLKVSTDVGAKRIFNAVRPDEEKSSSVEELKQKNIDRTASDKRRYKKYYDIDPTNQTNYDLVIDTTTKTIDQVTNQIVEFVRKKVHSEKLIANHKV